MGHTGALIRGGNFNNGTNAGPLAVNGNNEPSNSNNNIGFRCAR
jgi:formylglycine-generating enzyme required for sulfatase activity